MAFSTAAEVKDKDLSRLVTQAGWVDADIDDRIAEGDALLEACLAGIGYTLPFAATPPLVNRLSILYGRYACLRDIHHNFSPSQSAGDSFQHYLDQFNAIIDKLKARDIVLVDAAGAVLTLTATDTRTQINTDGVKRVLTMRAPEEEQLDTDLYADADRLNDPSD